MSDIVSQAKKKMTHAIEHLEEELRGIRTGRANPAILDPVMIEVYGTQMRLRDLANISAPESRMLLISPFDVQNVHAISKGIEKANLGMHPLVDGGVVRLKIPEMDQSVRQEMVKISKRKCEEAKISIRNVRRESNDAVKKDKEIPEDLAKRFEKQIQEQTDKFCKEADELFFSKEKEILTV
ncbi:MAG: ribosome recycling factor [Chlamydiia bacterium]|nr:ribosome recycling factor [Chlamydiia bacterium]